MDVNINATLTGGTTAVLTPAGIIAGKALYTAPLHSRIKPRTVEITSAGPKGGPKDRKVARSGLRIIFADVVEAGSGCCDAKAGTVRIYVNMDWDLSQPESLVDSAVAHLRAIVYKNEFVAALKTGVLPQN